MLENNLGRRGGELTVAGYRNHEDDATELLRRIEGQVRGAQRMVDQDLYWIAALQSVALIVLGERLKCWVDNAATAGCHKADARGAEAPAAIAGLLCS